MEKFRDKNKQSQSIEHDEFKRPPMDSEKAGRIEAARENAEREDDNTEPSVSPEQAPPEKRKNKHLLWLGLIAIIPFVWSMVSSISSGTIYDVRGDGIGRGMQAGVILGITDEVDWLEAKDFDIEMKKNETLGRMLVWDFLAEDGDFVTVRVDGTELYSNIRLMNKPMVLEIPVPSVVEVVGIEDGGGGITYGVKFPGAVQNNAYFNIVAVGDSNFYTLTGQ